MKRKKSKTLEEIQKIAQDPTSSYYAVKEALKKIDEANAKVSTESANITQKIGRQEEINADEYNKKISEKNTQIDEAVNKFKEFNSQLAGTISKIYEYSESKKRELANVSKLLNNKSGETGIVTTFKANVKISLIDSEVKFCNVIEERFEMARSSMSGLIDECNRNVHLGEKEALIAKLWKTTNDTFLYANEVAKKTSIPVPIKKILNEFCKATKALWKLLSNIVKNILNEKPVKVETPMVVPGTAA